MERNRETFHTTGTEALSDAELSGQLGHYQKQARVWLRVGLIGIAGGLISFFTVHHAALKVILVTVLFFGGICCVLFLKVGAEKKIKRLMQEQMGTFFQAELEKAFGPDLHTPEMYIDQLLMKEFCLPDGQWEECETENFHEGDYHGIHFSAANVRLNHVYEGGNIHDGKETLRDVVFRGLVLRCRTGNTAPSPIGADTRTENNPQFMEMVHALEQSMEGRVLRYHRKGDIFSLAIETNYEFAAVAGDVDLSNLDAVRGSYIASLQEMGTALDLLLKNTALFAGVE